MSSLKERIKKENEVKIKSLRMIKLMEESRLVLPRELDLVKDEILNQESPCFHIDRALQNELENPTLITTLGMLFPTVPSKMGFMYYTHMESNLTPEMTLKIKDLNLAQQKKTYYKRQKS